MWFLYTPLKWSLDKNACVLVIISKLQNNEWFILVYQTALTLAKLRTTSSGVRSDGNREFLYLLGMYYGLHGFVLQFLSPGLFLLHSIEAELTAYRSCMAFLTVQIQYKN